LRCDECVTRVMCDVGLRCDECVTRVMCDVLQIAGREWGWSREEIAARR
jgi:hypothetical protein